MRQLHNTRGFTLIELLLYVAVIGTLLIAMISFFAMVTSAGVKNQSVSEVNQQGSLAMDYITQTIRNADSITTPAAGATGSSLTLVVPTGGLSPTIFDLSGTTLRVKEGAAAYVSLTSSKVQISSLTFKNLTRSGTPGVVQVSFIVTRVNTTGRNEYDYVKTFTGTAALR